MTAVVFLRVKNTDSKTRNTFLCSKTRVASLEKLTIPRSSRLEELTGISLDELFGFSRLDKFASFMMKGIRTKSGYSHSGASPTWAMEAHSRKRKPI